MRSWVDEGRWFEARNKEVPKESSNGREIPFGGIAPLESRTHNNRQPWVSGVPRVCLGTPAKCKCAAASAGDAHGVEAFGAEAGLGSMVVRWHCQLVPVTAMSAPLSV